MVVKWIGNKETTSFPPFTGKASKKFYDECKHNTNCNKKYSFYEKKVQMDPVYVLKVSFRVIRNFLDH